MAIKTRWYGIEIVAWWRHQMETFSALLSICAGNSSVADEFPAKRPVTRSFDVFFDLRLNKRLSKQLWDWCFDTLSRPLWRHCYGLHVHDDTSMKSLFPITVLNPGVGKSASSQRVGNQLIRAFTNMVKLRLGHGLVTTSPIVLCGTWSLIYVLTSTPF